MNSQMKRYTGLGLGKWGEDTESPNPLFVESGHATTLSINVFTNQEVSVSRDFIGTALRTYMIKQIELHLQPPLPFLEVRLAQICRHLITRSIFLVTSMHPEAT